jgi:hypothetical protein
LKGKAGKFIILNINKENDIIKSEITMEVHHHPHVEKKGFKEYFLEFLMIFLAVTLGFFAENIREKLSDRNKEKEYVSSLLEDLKTDTASFNTAISANKLLIKGGDSVLNLLSANLRKRDSAELAMIYFFKYEINNVFAPLTDRTISQLKNNGDMRLIKDKVVSDAILSYYNFETGLTSESNDIDICLRTDDNEANSIFNIKANRALYDSFMIATSFGPFTSVYRAKELLTYHGPALSTYDPKIIAKFMADIDYHRGSMMAYAELLLRQNQYAGNLIKLIQTQYHLQKP